MIQYFVLQKILQYNSQYIPIYPILHLHSIPNLFFEPIKIIPSFLHFLP